MADNSGVVSVIQSKTAKGKNLKKKKIKWWCYPFIPKNKFILLAAEGGTGKSTVIYDFIADFTMEKPLLLGEKKGGGGMGSEKKSSVFVNTVLLFVD